MLSDRARLQRPVHSLRHAARVAVFSRRISTAATISRSALPGAFLRSGVADGSGAGDRHRASRHQSRDGLANGQTSPRQCSLRTTPGAVGRLCGRLAGRSTGGRCRVSNRAGARPGPGNCRRANGGRRSIAPVCSPWTDWRGSQRRNEVSAKSSTRWRSIWSPPRWPTPARVMEFPLDACERFRKTSIPFSRQNLCLCSPAARSRRSVSLEPCCVPPDSHATCCGCGSRRAWPPRNSARRSVNSSRLRSHLPRNCDR